MSWGSGVSSDGWRINNVSMLFPSKPMFGTQGWKDNYND